MSEISFNSIFDGVTLALHAAFPSAQVHGGSVRQGLREGDFNVVMPGAGHKQEVGQRYKRTPTVDVIYYPIFGETWCYTMIDPIISALENITTPGGDIIHAVSCTWTITNGVLHVLLNYDHFVYRPREEVTMGELKIKQEG